MHGSCMEVLHGIRSYTMGNHGSPDIYNLSPRASDVYIGQTTRARGITIKINILQICLIKFSAYPHMRKLCIKVLIKSIDT